MSDYWQGWFAGAAGGVGTGIAAAILAAWRVVRQYRFQTGPPNPRPKPRQRGG